MMVAHSIASISRAVLDLFYPPTCPGCGRDVAEEPDLICYDCWHRLTYLTGPFCQTCGCPTRDAVAPRQCDQCPAPTPAFDQCRSVVTYCDVMRQILHAYKFHGRKRLSRPLSRLLLWGYNRYYAGQSFDAVVPVPLHSSRLREREFNQATEMLRHLQKEVGLTLEENIVRRVRPTVPQSTLPGSERYANVAGAFDVNDEPKVRDGRILVVDDMLTTGSTVSEISRVLKKHGARFVAVLTACRNIGGTAGYRTAQTSADTQP